MASELSVDVGCFRVGGLPRALVRAPADITNVWALFDALAVDWSPGAVNRRVVGGRHPNAFIRIPSNGGFGDRLMAGDIPIQSGSYILRGFLRFEVETLFPGLLSISQGDDYIVGELTAVGVEVARSGLLSFDNSCPNVRAQPFFQPRTKPAISALVKRSHI